MATKKRGVGRPRKGRGGEKISDYAPITIRLPPEVRDALKAASIVGGEPVSVIVEEALALYLKSLSRGDRALVNSIVARHAKK